MCNWCCFELRIDSKVNFRFYSIISGLYYFMEIWCLYYNVAYLVWLNSWSISLSNQIFLAYFDNLSSRVGKKRSINLYCCLLNFAVKISVSRQKENIFTAKRPINSKSWKYKSISLSLLIILSESGWRLRQNSEVIWYTH